MKTIDDGQGPVIHLLSKSSDKNISTYFKAFSINSYFLSLQLLNVGTMWMTGGGTQECPGPLTAATFQAPPATSTVHTTGDSCQARQATYARKCSELQHKHKENSKPYGSKRPFFLVVNLKPQSAVSQQMVKVTRCELKVWVKTISIGCPG